ncbi:hypothetical protein FRC08_016316, partial [Ceratobasidium sp. 394]
MASSGAASTPLSNPEIGFYTDVLILFILLFFTLTALPCIILRLTHTSARRDGWIILRGTSSPPSSSPYTTRINESTFSVTRKPTLRRALSERTLDLGTTESETWGSSFGASQSKTILGGAHTTLHLQHARGEPSRLLVRCLSYSSLLQPASKLFSARLGGYSVGQFVLLAGYAALMGVAMFIYASPVDNVKRAGFVCISQIPVVFALGTKNSLVGWFVGMGYEKLNYIHRWVGQIMFITGLFHVVGYLVKWTKTGVISIAAKNQLWGWMAFGGLVFCAVLSLPAIRRSSYQIFWHSHWIGLVIMVFS